jgi:hypothetical protein
MAMTLPGLIMFIALHGIYEPSAIQQLPDGRFLVAEDEKEFPFSLLAIHPDGSTTQESLIDDAGDESPGKLDDLEGLTTDNVGFVYAITSHSRNSKGEEKKSREKLVRFRVEGNRLTSVRILNNLKRALTAAHPLLAKASAITDVKGEGGFNIEALEFSADQRNLMIGFRSPLDAGRALVATIKNPVEMFESGAAPNVSPDLIRLDLGGDGLRGMSWVPSLQGYLLISGPVTKAKTQFRLWFWKGQADAKARPAEVEGLPGFEYAEGVTPAVIDGKPRIVIVSDDGSREEGRTARYLQLDPEKIRILP